MDERKAPVAAVATVTIRSTPFHHPVPDHPFPSAPEFTITPCNSLERLWGSPSTATFKDITAKASMFSRSRPCQRQRRKPVQKALCLLNCTLALVLPPTALRSRCPGYRPIRDSLFDQS